MGEKILRTRESDMAEIVKDFLKHKHKIILPSGTEYLKCDVAIRELRLSGGVIFDVVGFSRQDKTFYIVECKTGANPTDVGHAFGQILAYKCVLQDRGYDFFKEFYDRVKNEDPRVMGLEDINDIIDAGKFQSRFFVALKQRVCTNYDFLRSLKRSFKEGIGIIRFRERKGKRECRLYIRVEKNQKDFDLCRSELVTVVFQRRYDREEFLKKVEERFFQQPEIRHLIKRVTRNPPRYYQFRFGHAPFHFEVQPVKNRVEVALDVEPSKRELKEVFFNFIEKQRKEIENQLAFEPTYRRNWLNNNRWGRISKEVVYSQLSNKTLNLVVETLVKFVNVLKPLVDEFYTTRRYIT
jgi:hypothetical protein